MEIVNRKNIRRIKRSNDLHLEKLSRFLLNYLVSTDNALIELQRLNINYKVREHEFYHADKHRPLQVSEFIDKLLMTGIKAVRLIPGGNVLVMHAHGCWQALP